MFNKSGASGSLFGNANTSTPAGTPTPAMNAFQQPQKSTGLFGGAPSASTPTPAGGLFGQSAGTGVQSNTSSAGGLFGNKPAGSTSGNSIGSSLFGNNSNIGGGTGGTRLFGNSNTGTGTGSSSLFGNKTSTAPTSSLGAGGLFGNSNSTGGTSLFGNTKSNSTSLLGSTNNKPTGLFGTSSNPQQQTLGVNNSLQPSRTNQNPYGIDLSGMSSNLTAMPESITASLMKSNKNSIEKDGAKTQHRNSSVSSSVNSLDANLPQPTLMSQLSSRLKSMNGRSSTQGIFSPSKHNPWISEGLRNKTQINTEQSKVYTAEGLIGDKNNQFAEMRKLKIDPTRSSAKKIRLFSDSTYSTKNYDNQNNLYNHNKTGGKRTEVESTHPAVGMPSKENAKKLVQIKNPTNNQEYSDYWCSPTVQQLSNIPKDQLKSVSNFMIGRKNYGCISFNYDVDLTDFSPDFAANLFDNTVAFRSNRTVVVYPDESKKPSIGSGINVPATISLENVYPIDKKSKKPSTDPSDVLAFQLFVKKLKGMRDMEFISYNPYGGIWTFRVNHFSIWGLVDEEDAEIDEENNANEVSEVGNDTLRYIPQRGKSKLVFDNGEPEPYHNQPNLHEKEEEDAAVPEEESLNDFIEEKEYEPNVSDEGFEGLEANPQLDVTYNWVDQLQLCGSSLSSIFAGSSDLNTANSDKIDSIFTEFNEGLALEKRIKAESRIKQPYQVANFGTDSSLIVASLTNISLKSLPNYIDKKNNIITRLYRKSLNSAVITNRKQNNYPHLVKAATKFTDVAMLNEHNSKDSFWSLASILFDPIVTEDDIEEEAIKNKLAKKKRWNMLCSWITRKVKEKVNNKLMNTTNPLERVFLHLCVNDIINASQTSMNSNNPHLAVLVTNLGSNDPRIRDLASGQLKAWSSNGQAIDLNVKRIYGLLSGDFIHDTQLINDLKKEFGWLVPFGLCIYYGQIDEKQLEEIVSFGLQICSADEVEMEFTALQLFSMPSTLEYAFRNIQLKTNDLNILHSWCFLQILRSNIAYAVPDNLFDSLTLQLIEQLKTLKLFEESLYLACCINNDNVAKQQIALILYHNIEHIQECRDLLTELKIPQNDFQNSLALHAKYTGDCFSQANHLLCAQSYTEAKDVLIKKVALDLILKSKESGSFLYLETLRELLSQFPRNIANELNVFQDYLKFTIDGDKSTNMVNSLINEICSLSRSRKDQKSVSICCDVMARDVISKVIKTDREHLLGISKETLLSLPLGYPERSYYTKALT